MRRVSAPTEWQLGSAVPGADLVSSSLGNSDGEDLHDLPLECGGNPGRHVQGTAEDRTSMRKRFLETC